MDNILSKKNKTIEKRQYFIYNKCIDFKIIKL
jgi:hypothetical protein